MRAQSAEAAGVEISLQIAGYGRALEVRELRGTEAISEMFELALTLVSDDTSLPLDSLVGSSAVLALTHGAHGRTIHGMLSYIAQGRTTAQNATYRAALVP